MQCPECGSRDLSFYGETYVNEETGDTKICYSEALGAGLLVFAVAAGWCGLLVLPAGLDRAFPYFHIAFSFGLLCFKAFNQEIPEGYKKYAHFECDICKNQWRGLWNQPISE